MEGKAPLRTLGELAAFFAAKEDKGKTPAPPAAASTPESKEAPPPATTNQPPTAEHQAPENPVGEAPPS